MAAAMAKLVSLDLLRTFTVVAKHLSITWAARELNLTQAAISQQVRLLESQLTTPLFTRTNRGLLLTHAGQQYLQRIEQSIIEIDRATQALVPNQQPLRVAVDSAFAHTWLVKRLSDFRKQHPQCEIEVVLTPSLQDLTNKSITTTADVCIVYGKPPWAGFAANKLLEFVEFPVCSKAYFKKASAKKADALASGTLIHEGNHSGWQRWLAAAKYENVDVNRGPVVHDSLTCLRMAVEGEGFAIGDNLTCADFIKQGELIKPFSHELLLAESFYLLIDDKKTTLNNVKIFNRWLFECL